MRLEKKRNSLQTQPKGNNYEIRRDDDTRDDEQQGLHKLYFENVHHPSRCPKAAAETADRQGREQTKEP